MVSTHSRTNQLVKIAMLSALAFVVMFFETPPLFSGFLKIDFSDIIALIGGFALGPLAGVMIELLKNLLHLTMSQTLGVGELGNFIVGAAFVGASSWAYHKKGAHMGLTRALVIGSAVMVVAAAFANYFILLPLYASALGFSTAMVVDMTHAINPYVTDGMSFILFAIVPFNIVKAVVVSLVTRLVYKYVAPLIAREHAK